MNAYRTTRTDSLLTVATASGRVVFRAVLEVPLHWEIRIGKDRHKAIGSAEEVLVKGFQLLKVKQDATRKMHQVRQAPRISYRAGR